MKFIKTFCIYFDSFSVMGKKKKYRKLKEAIFVKHINPVFPYIFLKCLRKWHLSRGVEYLVYHGYLTHGYCDYIVNKLVIVIR